MESRKLKGIAIFILATVNLCLLALIASRGIQTAQAEETARTQVIEIMAEHGIVVREEDIPREVELPQMQVVRDPEWERQTALALLGEDAQADRDMLTYHGEKGTARFYVDGEFYAEFVEGAHVFGGSSPEEYALTLLEKAGFQGRVVSYDGESLVIEQQVDGVPIFSCQATLEIAEGELTQIALGSRRLVGEPQSQGGEELISVPMALLRWLDFVQRNGDFCSEIQEMTLGYVMDTQSLPLQLRPTWRIVATVGTGERAYGVDGITGEVTRR